MEKPIIINIINFVRGIEPREKMDLVEPVKRQLELLDQYKMRGTFLLQYDALIDDSFTSILKDTRHEIGGWFEIVEPLVKSANIEWRGRFPWDWHSNVGFSVGYSPAEREKLVDCYMKRFYEIWGYYPKSVGSWMIDAHTLEYMGEKYGVIASCNCKDQWGTDGYTIWGGYYNQAYYPSKTNSLMPAQNVSEQISVPIFRMLGSDPIYQYDAGLTANGAAELQNVVTLEPVYPEGGGDSKWVSWFFNDVLHTPSLSFGYTQVGQENSFGWPAMKEGLEDQFRQLAILSNETNVRIETLAESGEWYKDNFSKTPTAAISALTDWKGEGRKSVWFSSSQYRVNFYSDNNNIWIRDLHLFNESYQERYLIETCKTPQMIYDTLPIIDGNRWSTEIRAGWYFYSDNKKLIVKDIKITDNDEKLELMVITEEGKIKILCQEDSLVVNTSIPLFTIFMEWGNSKEKKDALIDNNKLSMVYEGFQYSVEAKLGSFSADNVIEPNEEGIIYLQFGN